MPSATTSRASEFQAGSYLDPQLAEPQPGKVPQETPTAGSRRPSSSDPLMTAEDVAKRLRVSTDWVWDHSSRKKPLLPVIRMGDGTLRYRSSAIELFIDEHERLSVIRRRAV